MAQREPFPALDQPQLAYPVLNKNYENCMLAKSVLIKDQRDAGRVPMQEILTPDRPNFTGREKAGHRDVAADFVNCSNVMIRLAPHPCAPPVAGAKDRSGR